MGEDESDGEDESVDEGTGEGGDGRPAGTLLSELSRTTSYGEGSVELVSDNGVVVSSAGYVYGIKANLSGLAPTRFRRGLGLGRNRILGPAPQTRQGTSVIRLEEVAPPLTPPPSSAMYRAP